MEHSHVIQKYRTERLEWAYIGKHYGAADRLCEITLEDNMTHRYFASLLMIWAAALLIAAPPAQAQAELVPVQAPSAHTTTSTVLKVTDDDTYEIEFIAASTDADGNQTWQYRVTELSGKDLSNWTIALCVSPTEIVSYSPTAEDEGISEVNIGTDPNTDITGIKWNGPEDDDFDNDGDTGGDSRIFSFTIKRELPLDDTPVEVGAKAGPTEATGLIAGPDCNADCPAPQEIESSEMRNGTGYVTTEFTTSDGVDAVTFTLLDNLEVVTVPTEFELADTDSDLDGTPDTGDADDDNDGTPDTDDADDDGDGVDDANEAGNVTYVFTGSTPPSTATFELGQKDTDNLEARYFAIARSACGTIALFDPVKTFASGAQAESFGLEGSYPNPTRGMTTVGFSLDETSPVRLAIYDVMGRKVATLVDAPMQAGQHEVRWDGRSDQGHELASGVYFYRLSAGDVSQTKRLTIIR